MPSYKSGFYHPISILILALITLTVALAIFANSGFFSNKNVPTPSQTPQLSPKSSPKTSPALSNPATNPDLIGASWKTYTNAKQKYSLNYPGDWIVKEEEDSLRSDNITTFTTFFTKDGNSIAIEVNPQGIGFGSENIKRETIIVAGKEVSKFTILGSNGKTQSINTLIDKPEVGFIFQANETYQNNEEAVKVYDKILATFQFLN